MSRITGTPSMSHSPAYYQNRTNISGTPSDAYGAPSSQLRQPPPARLYQQHRRPPSVAISLATQRSSEPGRYSNPTGLATPPLNDVGKDSPHSTASHPFSFSSDAEQGSINRDPKRSSNRHLGRGDAVLSQRSSWPARGSAEDNTTTYTYLRENGGEERIADHAVLVLFWLACFNPFYSLFSALYTICVILTLSILTPVRLCHPSSSFQVSALRALAPLLRLHLRLMHAESARDADELEFRAGQLIAVQVLSPVVSAGVAVAEWIAAPFWIFAIMMGNPDGTERRDDGRATVLAVRNWWEKYLLKAAIRRPL